MDAQALGFGIDQKSFGICHIADQKAQIHVAAEDLSGHIVAVSFHQIVMDSFVLILQISSEEQIVDKIQLLRCQKQAGAGSALHVGKVLLQCVGSGQNASCIVDEVLSV